MTAFVPAYRPRPSPLHVARASMGCAFCAALALPGLLFHHPLVLGAGIAAIVLAGACARVLRDLGRVALLGIPLALLVTLVNPLVYQEGETLLVRGGGVFGRRFDVTLEALAAGGVAGLRVLAVMLAFGLFSAAVDPDRVMVLFARISRRSALTAALTTRLVPVLARDARRMAEAGRCRPQRPPRTLVVRAAVAGALDRAVDVAAALEVRGYGAAARPRSARAAWSRHDLRLALASAVLAAFSVWGVATGAAAVEFYPEVSVPLGAREWLLAGALVAAALVPFTGPAARLGVRDE